MNGAWQKLVRLWCRIFGHQWTPWADDGDERCRRCLRWKDWTRGIDMERVGGVLAVDGALSDGGGL